jgi:hypothetical protein
MSHPVYQSADVDGVSVFYREGSASGWRPRTRPGCGR